MRTLQLTNAARRALQGLYQSRLPTLGAYVPEMWGGNDPAKWAMASSGGAGTIGLRVRAAGIQKTGSCSIQVCWLRVAMKVVFRIKREYRDIRYVDTEILG